MLFVAKIPQQSADTLSLHGCFFSVFDSSPTLDPESQTGSQWPPVFGLHWPRIKPKNHQCHNGQWSCVLWSVGSLHQARLRLHASVCPCSSPAEGHSHQHWLPEGFFNQQQVDLFDLGVSCLSARLISASSTLCWCLCRSSDAAISRNWSVKLSDAFDSFHETMSKLEAAQSPGWSLKPLSRKSPFYFSSTETTSASLTSKWKTGCLHTW